MPSTFTVSSSSEVKKLAGEISYPIVAKTILGRGSFGINVFHNQSEYLAHAEELSNNSMFLTIEESLQGNGDC